MTLKFKDVPIESPNMHLVSGEPGGGKTVTVFSIADRLHKQTGKDVYVTLREEDKKIEEFKVPKHIHSHVGFNYPVDSIVVTDDLQRLAHARRFQSDVNVYLDQQHALLRHDNIDFIYDTQTLTGIDRNNILRSNYRWYKRPYQLERDFGRPEVATELELSDIALADKGKKYAYIFSRAYEGLVSDIPLPKYWSEELSRLHRRRPSMIESFRRVKIFG